ncbi:hypothetical protein BH11BAC4_BH11BAC4_23440 [soil metagenome]
MSDNKGQLFKPKQIEKFVHALLVIFSYRQLIKFLQACQAKAIIVLRLNNSSSSFRNFYAGTLALRYAARLAFEIFVASWAFF